MSADEPACRRFLKQRRHFLCTAVVAFLQPPVQQPYERRDGDGHLGREVAASIPAAGAEVAPDIGRDDLAQTRARNLVASTAGERTNVVAVRASVLEEGLGEGERRRVGRDGSGDFPAEVIQPPSLQIILACVVGIESRTRDARLGADFLHLDGVVGLASDQTPAGLL